MKMASPSAMEVRRIKCLFCDSTFRDNFNVRRHINSRHPEMAKEITRINCSLCGLIYIRKKGEKPPVEMCEECKKRTDISPPELYNFKDEEEFNKWKQKLELDTSTRYVKSRKVASMENGTIKTEFPCYRSTFITPKSTRLKVNEVGSSNKKVPSCPAKMICEISPKGAVSVSFFSEHKGHSLDANKMLEKVNRKREMNKPRPPMVSGIPMMSPPPMMAVDHSLDMHLDYSFQHPSDSMSNDYFTHFNPEENLSNHYNSDLDLVLSQIENEGEMASNGKKWLSSFCNVVGNLASNTGSNFALKSGKLSYKNVLRDNNVPEPQINYEAQSSNRMTEEERQSIIQMVLDDL